MTLRIMYKCSAIMIVVISTYSVFRDIALRLRQGLLLAKDSKDKTDNIN